jgi:hypothetical protein
MLTFWVGKLDVNILIVGKLDVDQNVVVGRDRDRDRKREKRRRSPEQNGDKRSRSRSPRSKEERRRDAKKLSRWAGLQDFSWHNIPKQGELYQMATKLPNGLEIYQMAVIYSKWP